MLQSIHPKLPMRNKQATKHYYLQQLGFSQQGGEFPDYLMVRRDDIELHFFLFEALDPYENYGQVYIRSTNIEALYAEAVEKALPMPTLGKLENKPWGQKEFSLLDPDHNLLTFGQPMK